MARERQTEGLRRNVLFDRLDERQVEAIDQRCLWIRCEEGHQIIGQSDPTTDVFFVIEGVVRAKSYSGTGREVSFVDITAGKLFGEFSAIDGRPRASSVVAMTPCLLARMSAEDFQRTLSENPEAALKLISLLVGKTRSLSDRVFEFSTLPVQSRVHVELLRLAEQVGGDGSRAVIQPAPTHQELATRISTHREAVTRELNHLASDNLISLRRRRVEILDLPRLRAMVEEALNG